MRMTITGSNVAMNSDGRDINLVAHHRDLLSRVAETADRQAFRELFEHFAPRIKAWLLKSGADAALAEDLMQDVMMTVWRKVGLYNPQAGAASTWIFTIARNARIDRLRRASSRPYVDIDDIELPSEAGDGEDEAFASQRAELIAAALDDLPPEQKQIMEMAFVEDMPQSEIADRLTLPLGTVKSRMRLAYTKLRSKLEVLQ